MSIVSFLLK